MSLSEHVRTLARGSGRARSLTFDEAGETMALMLDGAAPEAVGALLMLLRRKGETAQEIAGFAAAAHPTLAGLRKDSAAFETEIVLGTAELAFDTLGHARPRALTSDLWSRCRRDIVARKGATP